MPHGDAGPSLSLFATAVARELEAKGDKWDLKDRKKLENKRKSVILGLSVLVGKLTLRDDPPEAFTYFNDEPASIFTKVFYLPSSRGDRQNTCA